MKPRFFRQLGVSLRPGFLGLTKKSSFSDL